MVAGFSSPGGSKGAIQIFHSLLNYQMSLYIHSSPPTITLVSHWPPLSPDYHPGYIQYRVSACILDIRRTAVAAPCSDDLLRTL